jgi:hypothetical protein
MANLTGGPTPLPVYLRPRNVLACTLLPLTQNSDGTFAKGTVGDFVTTQVLESVEIESETEQEDITPTNALNKNSVLIRNDFSITVVEKKLANIANNLGLAGYGAFDYFLVTVKTSPDGTILNYVQAVFVRSTFRDAYGTNNPTTTLSGRCCGLPIAISATTPTWT